jgi:hypothetical protein
MLAGTDLLSDADEEVRAWLERLGLGNTTRTLDQLAVQVRYFRSGLDTEPAAVSDLLGWVTGLSLNGNGGPALGAAELPGTTPLRPPWKPGGRGALLVPLGHQIGRWAILGGLTLLTIASVGMAIWYAIRYWP